MSNILNSHISAIENPIAARKLRKEKVSRFVQPPETPPKYSIDDVLKEKDEFRRSVIQGTFKETKKQRNNFMPKALLFLAVVTTFFMFKCK